MIYFAGLEEIFSQVVLFTSLGSKQKCPVGGGLNTDQTLRSGLDPDQISATRSGLTFPV